MIWVPTPYISTLNQLLDKLKEERKQRGKYGSLATSFSTSNKLLIQLFGAVGKTSKLFLLILEGLEKLINVEAPLQLTLSFIS